MCAFGAHILSLFALKNLKNTKKINENHVQIPQKFLGAFGAGSLNKGGQVIKGGTSYLEYH